MVLTSDALIESGFKETSSSTYQLLLQVDADPNSELHIRKIEISLSTYIPTSTTTIKVEIDGKIALRDFTPVVATTTLTFGGKLIYKGKMEVPPIKVYVKSDGTTVRATAIVTGIKKPYYKRII